MESNMPEAPLLILYSQRGRGADSPVLSFLAITIDKDMDIDPKACDCRKRPDCRTAVVQRSGGGSLTARRYATQRLDNWNLATMGAFWNPKSPEPSYAVHNVKFPWLQIDFRISDERAEFTRHFRDCKDLFNFQMKDYYQFKGQVKEINVVKHEP